MLVCTACCCPLQELDFVAANVVMAIIADFMLVWLPAPTLSYAAAAAAGKFNLLGKMFAGCPDNAFQKVQPGMPAFTLMQRLGAPVRNGLKLACVGFSASMIGVCMTNALIALRQALDPAFVPLNQSQDVIATSLAYGAYMATSSNIRYAGKGQFLKAVASCLLSQWIEVACCALAGILELPAAGAGCGLVYGVTAVAVADQQHPITCCYSQPSV
jgi:hypothetical protein